MTAPLAVLRAQDASATGDVRQIVTFLLAPRAMPQVQAIYADSLRPIYARVPQMLHVRGYREVESPEPLDLVIVTKYASMAAMDSANRALRGFGTFALYGAISALAQHHHDQFVAIDPRVSDPPRADSSTALTVFEYLRITPGNAAKYLELLRTRGRAAERAAAPAVHTETGRMLVADGWDVLRTHTVASLGAWQALVTARWNNATLRDADRLVSARKVIIVREEPSVRVR